MSKNTKVTKDEVKLIKTLLDAGVSKSKACEIADRSWGVIDAVEKTEDYEGYRAHVRSLSEENEKYKNKSEKTEDELDTAAGAVVYTLKSMNAKLRELDEKLDELLEKQGKKKGWL